MLVSLLVEIDNEILVDFSPEYLIKNVRNITMDLLGAKIVDQGDCHCAEDCKQYCDFNKEANA